MCGRYTYPLNEALLGHFYQQLPPEDQEIVQTDIVYPGKPVLVLGQDSDGKVRARALQWGFPGFEKGQLLINARAESITEKPTFRTAFRHRRCLFPMARFYEWSTDKTRYLFNGQDVLYVGGCYQMKEGQAQAVLMTQAAGPVVAPIHHRMPYFVAAQDLRQWLKDPNFAQAYTSPTLELFAEQDGDPKKPQSLTIGPLA